MASFDENSDERKSRAISTLKILCHGFKIVERNILLLKKSERKRKSQNFSEMSPILSEHCSCSMLSVRVRLRFI